MQEVVDAARRWQRLSVFVAVAVGLAGGTVSRWADSVDSPLSLLGLVAPLVVVVVAVREVVLPPGTAELQVDERSRAFFAPPGARRVFTPVMTGWVAYMAVDLDGLLPLWILLAVVLLLLVVVSWRRVPMVTLTEDGISGTAPPAVVVPWAALGPSGVVTAGGGTVRLRVVRPELVRSRWRRDEIRLATRELAVAPALLAAAITYYVAHPERRTAIGTLDEYGRLRRELAGGLPPGRR